MLLFHHEDIFLKLFAFRLDLLVSLLQLGDVLLHILKFVLSLHSLPSIHLLLGLKHLFACFIAFGSLNKGSIHIGDFTLQLILVLTGCFFKVLNFLSVRLLNLIFVLSKSFNFEFKFCRKIFKSIDVFFLQKR